MEELVNTLKHCGKTVYKFEQKDEDAVIMIKFEENSFVKIFISFKQSKL
ncbi:p6 [Cordyline virus 1]|uniref:p6 n=1 Tax=Cordyline virus 1 TaxID=937809 RepID=E7CT66_9CLOS|nr:p6 [Cordyline virus 1]ADU03658.1 p6 [Cordyline virus 1]